MTQGVLPYKYEEEKRETGMTSLGGLPVYLDLATVMGLGEGIERHLQIKHQGWTDRQMVMSLLMLNLAGGDCVEDMRKLENDEGFCRVLERIEQKRMKRRERRSLSRRWRKACKRFVPSSSSVFRYLSSFHNAEEEKKRVAGKAFIPASNQYLRGLSKVNGEMMGFMQAQDCQETATLDQDATLVSTSKADALYSYKGYKSYQPLNTWWSEHQAVLHTEFRDGNVPAGYEQLRVLKEALSLLPDGVRKVRLRSDTAGYQHELMKYCEMGENERFGRIEFAIGSDVTPEFKKAVLDTSAEDWQAIYSEYDGIRTKTNQEWADVCFIPNAIGYSKNAPTYRYIAIREAMGSADLPGLDWPQPALPFPTMKISQQHYKVFGIVTNMDWEGESLIHWHRERCGKSEEAHSVMKEDFAGGKLPSGDFGENAAWWWIMIMAMNLNTAMKRLALGKGWLTKRMKAIRFSLINIPGRIMERSREMFIRLSKNNPVAELLILARSRIKELSFSPSG